LTRFDIIINPIAMNKLARAAVVVLVLLGAAAFYWGHRRDTAAGVQIGDPAPEFTLPTLGRGAISLAGFPRQVVVLNFWATWCPPCVAEAPSLEKFSVETKPLGVTVIGVSVDQDPAALEKFIADYHLTFPIARDPEQQLAWRFGTFKFPETYIIDRNGRVAEKIVGAVDWQDPRMIAFVSKLAPGGADPEK
jgi:cytochrome c biogenesis protein CcmG, thiol:disulfide interchange protein DsbE